MAVDDALDLKRIDADPAAFHHIFLAPHHKQEAFLVEISEVAGVEPAVAKRGVGRFGVLVITMARERTLANNFTHVANLNGVTMIVDDAQIDAPDRSPRRVRLGFHIGRLGDRHLSGIRGCIGAIDIRRDIFSQRFEHRRMHLAAGDGQTAQGAGIVPGRLQNVQHALAHGRHGADVGDLVSFDGLEHFLGVEPLVQDHRPAEVDNSQCKRSSGVEINRRRQNRRIVRAKAFLDRVIDAVKDESPLGREAALGKPRRSRREQDREWIVFVDGHRGLIGALAVEQPAVTQVRGERERFKKF